MKENEVRFTVDIPKELHKRLKIKAAEEGISIRELLVGYIELLMKEKGDICLEEKPRL